MYFSCDVGKYLDSKRGTLDLNNYDYESLMGTTFNMDKKQRIQTFASGSSHAMTLMAVDLDMIMTDEWFEEYMFRLVVERKYVPQNILNMLQQKPIRLPAWDPMFAPEQ